MTRAILGQAEDIYCSGSAALDLATSRLTTTALLSATTTSPPAATSSPATGMSPKRWSTRYFTTRVACMVGWNLQKNAKAPPFAVVRIVAPGLRSTSKLPSRAVALCSKMS